MPTFYNKRTPYRREYQTSYLDILQTKSPIQTLLLLGAFMYILMQWWHQNFKEQIV